MSLYKNGLSESSAQLIKKLNKFSAWFLRLKKVYRSICVQNLTDLCRKNDIFYVSCPLTA